MTDQDGNAQRERRWIILGEDGRYVTLGRHSDPTEAELADAERALIAKGVRGWLAVMEGNFWSRQSRVHLLMVRPMAAPELPFGHAAEVFESNRQRTLSAL